MEAKITGRVERVGGSPDSRGKHLVDMVESMPEHMRLRFETHLRDQKETKRVTDLKQHQLEIETAQDL